MGEDRRYVDDVELSPPLSRMDTEQLVNSLALQDQLLPVDADIEDVSVLNSIRGEEWRSDQDLFSNDDTSAGPPDGDASPLIVFHQESSDSLGVEPPPPPVGEEISVTFLLDSQPTLSQQIAVSSAPPDGTVPAVTDWPGDLGFCATVPPAPESNRKPRYMYSSLRNKLYLDMEVPVPVRFDLEFPDRLDPNTAPHQMYVRCMLVYPDPQVISQAVERCPTHKQPQHASNHGRHHLVEHVVRAENNSASYSSADSRFCVVVPYVSGGPDSPGHTVLYSFGCMNTCVGGIGRRRLVAIFQLEDERARVLGRRTIEVKVCKCPRRDFETDEGTGQKKRLLGGRTSGGGSAKRPRNNASSTATSGCQQHRFCVQVHSPRELELVQGILATHRALYPEPAPTNQPLPDPETIRRAANQLAEDIKPRILRHPPPRR